MGMIERNGGMGTGSFEGITKIHGKHEAGFDVEALEKLRGLLIRPPEYYESNQIRYINGSC